MALAGCGREGPGGATPAILKNGPVAMESRVPGPAAAVLSTADGGDRFLGVIVAGQQVDVAAEVSGQLEAVAVRVGDRVGRGQLLARLDADRLAQDLSMAEAALSALTAEVAKSRLRLDEAVRQHRQRVRFPDIFSQEEIARAALEEETGRADLVGTEARLAEQRARVRQLAGFLDRAEVRAPFAGTVALRYLDPGAAVGPGTPIVRLIGDGALTVRFAVPPAAAGALAPGHPVEVEVEGAPSLSAVVEQVAPEIDPPSQMVFVEARLEAPPAGATLPPAGTAVRVSPVGS